MGLFDLKHVKGRNDRRKQSHRGKFNTDHLNSVKATPEYNLPEVSESKLNTIKDGIKKKIAIENRRNILLAVLITSLVVYLLFSLGVFEYLNENIFEII